MFLLKIKNPVSYNETETIRGTTQIAACAATFSALMQRVHSAFHRKLPGRIWASTFRTGFHQSPLSLPKQYRLLCPNGPCSSSISYLTCIMIAQHTWDCKSILGKKFCKSIDNPVFGCYDKENFERKEPNTMKTVNTRTICRSLAPCYAQLA